MVNKISIIASMHIRASIRWLCCIDRPSMMMKKIVVSVSMMGSITRA